MTERKVRIFDTTLRDGTQGEDISFSVEDKLRIAKRLDDIGMHYIEGGWPGSNPKDLLFFDQAKKIDFNCAKLVAFGSTARAGNEPATDANLQALLQAGTAAIAIFGKAWLLHVRKALRVTPDENLRLIERSVAYLKSYDKEIVYDAEHFFDGYKDNPDYAIETLLAAERGGADVLVLCDTNGGTLTSELERIIIEVKEHVAFALGIHAHNDSELAVANTLAAVQNGCLHVQGTINGYGERCGNANLCSVIPNLQLKLGYSCLPDNKMSELRTLSHFVSEVANLAQPRNLAYVGKSAFAHKGGVHVSAVMRDARTYEHISPEQIGNRRRVLVSDLSGRSNIFYKANELRLDLHEHEEVVPGIVRKLKRLEHDGFQYEAAEGSLKLLIKKMIGDLDNYFTLEGFRVIIERNASGESRSEATIRVNVNGRTEHTASEGNGPVHALDQALRKALLRFYPEIAEMQLFDYKVRVLNEKDGTAAKVRVLVDSAANGDTWGTVGVSENIIEASWQALMEGISYFLLERSENREAARSVKPSKRSDQTVASL